jgi:hypothetical protein
MAAETGEEDTAAGCKSIGGRRGWASLSNCTNKIIDNLYTKLHGVVQWFGSCNVIVQVAGSNLRAKPFFEHFLITENLWWVIQL